MMIFSFSFQIHSSTAKNGHSPEECPISDWASLDPSPLGNQLWFIAT